MKYHAVLDWQRAMWPNSCRSRNEGYSKCVHSWWTETFVVGWRWIISAISKSFKTGCFKNHCYAGIYFYLAVQISHIVRPRRVCYMWLDANVYLVPSSNVFYVGTQPRTRKWRFFRRRWKCSDYIELQSLLDHKKNFIYDLNSKNQSFVTKQKVF